MDDFKLRAGEKIGALHDAALGVANNSKIKINDAVDKTVEAVNKIREVVLELWQHELVLEGRARAAAWAAEAVRRIREGALPLSPAVLYQELVDLFKDRVWRRSMVIFVCGAALGGGAGLMVGLRAGTRAPLGPHARALHTQSDQTVLLVEDAVSPGVSAGEVLVRVQSFSVCPVDRAVLRGRGSALRALLGTGPVTVGRGFAGVVLDVGQGVNDLELGDEVWGVVSEWSGGGASELLAIRRSRVSRSPRGVSPPHAAALPWGGTRALKALGKYDVKGKRVCVVGGNTSASCLFVQLLCGRGARVCVAEHVKAHPTMKALGAHEFIDLSSEAWWVSLEKAASRAALWDTLVLGDTAPNIPYKGLVKSSSRLCSISLRPPSLWTDRLPSPLWPAFCVAFMMYRLLRWSVGLGWHTDWLEDGHQSEQLELLREMVDEGQLAPVLDKVYMPHDFEAALAHACSDEAVGTTVIRFP
ncbi:unnamed protein product [Danaus chrysippus]|uniref:(African queen) hypothetical protein n=1 Tax=Danaus chrysippus TaxID=151541 RepID=A0A8J2QUQ1_9NEOP|nr:unnamed protein product [Danaus chrysippus]